MNAVRIEKNIDNTYTAYIFDKCISTGTYEDCLKALGNNKEYLF